MRILLIDHYAGSPRMGMEYRPYQMARRWVRMGHQVVLLAADHSHLRLHNPHVSRDFEEKEIGGVRYSFVRTPEYGPALGGRGKNAAAFVAKIWRAAPQLARRWNPEVVIASSTYPFDSWPARRIARLAGAGLVSLYYIHTARRQFGGVTGDLAGFFLQLCELGMVLAAVLAQKVEALL